MTIFSKAAQTICIGLLGTSAMAQSLDLIVTTPNGTIVELSLDQLDIMDQTEFTTQTIWIDDKVTFQGVALSAVLEQANARGTLVTMTALNDYAVDIPFAEIGEDYPIVATRMNGDTMPVRDKGPYWVVYPYDFDESFQTETTYARSIWQLKSLDVMD